jgi:hypothetical protein
MVANFISPGTMLNIVAGVIVACCVIFTVITELVDDTSKQTLVTFSRSINVFVIPLLSVVVYIFFIWGARIITG